MNTINSILQQFNLKLKLPNNILNLKVKGDFNEVDTELKVLPFKSNNNINLKEFKCYTIKGEEDLIILCPLNTFYTVAICRYFEDEIVGTIYNNIGKIVGHY